METTYDVAIIGGGVVGCSVLFELTNQGYTCVLLEKNPHLVSEASSGNSGMLHTGFDAVAGSIELECIQICQSRIYKVLERLGCPLQRLGATMVAWNENELQGLPLIMEKSQQAAVSDVTWLSVSQLYQTEPGLCSGAIGGLWIPGESVIDPWLMAIMLAENARQKKAKIQTNTRVMSIDQESNLVMKIQTTNGDFRSRCAINCAGLYGDVIDMLGGYNNFRILPRKGQYTVYNKTARSLINSSILPVPNDRTKGIIVFKSVYGNVIVGPTAEDIESKLRPTIDPVISDRLLTHALKSVDHLRNYDVEGNYVGVRPATEFKDYVIEADPQKSWVTVGGIRSTGVSGSLGIAQKVNDLVKVILDIEPSRGQDISVSAQPYHFTKFGTAVVGQHEYTVTHPISIFGQKGVVARM